MNERERRLVFGEVAELYDAARPTYPDALVADLVGWARAGGGRGSALEVGAGTGKATRLVAAQGVAVLAIEPSPEMAAVARRTTRGPGTVEVVESDFEHADLGARRFGLVYAAQAWHWVSQPEGYARARAALVDGGHLAVFWNRPKWDESPLRRDLNTAYEAHIPAELRGGPLHPAPGEASVFTGTDWEDEIAHIPGFVDAEVRLHDWSLPYTADGYADMLSTISEVRLLAAEDRARFLAVMREVIHGHGGAFTLAMQTRVCIARAA